MRQGDSVARVAKSGDMSILSEAELNAELEKGYVDIQAGRTREASEVFADIYRDYKL